MSEFHADAETIRYALESAFADWEAGVAALDRLLDRLQALQARVKELEATETVARSGGEPT